MREEGQTTMNKIDTVKAFSEALDARDFNKAASYLADDFVFAGPVPQPIGKQAFIAVQITGTHTRGLVLPMPGIPPIPATGKSVSLPEEHITFTFKGDKITSLTSDNVPGGGVAGVLAQIGVQLPPL
jgi:hypothetical protein